GGTIMSLSALVAFAQQHFGTLVENTRVGNATSPSTTGSPETLSERLPPRPGLPDWVRQRDPGQELPPGPDYPWRIEGPIDPQQPPPAIDALGPDALAFYAPFHFYREGWGIFIRMSGVLNLATKLKGGVLRPGDEQILELAEDILSVHEWHHAASEIAC